MWYLIVPALITGYLYKTGKLSAIPAQNVVLTLHFATVIGSMAFLGSLGSNIIRFYVFLAALLSSVVALLANYGVPGRTTYQAWLAQAAHGADFPFFMLTSIVLSAQSLGLGDVLAVAVVMRRALWALGVAVEKRRDAGALVRRVQEVWMAVRRKEGVILNVMSLFEIFIGFYLVGMLLTPSRQIFTVFVYWNFLRLRFNAPRSRPLHAGAWAIIERWAEPIVKIQIVGKGVDKVKSWFLQ